MAKGAYIGVSNVSKKIKKIYIGVGGTSRKVKKAYIGVGGVAKLFWSGGGGQLSYYGTTTMSQGCRSMASASVGNYALFAGGMNGNNSYTNVVEAYNASLTHSLPTQIKDTRYRAIGASIGNYAVITGGTYQSSYRRSTEAYDTSLTRTNPTNASVTHTDASAASVGNYALFAGGTGTNKIANVDAYNTSLTQSAATSLSSARSNFAGASVGDYALFAGGDDGTSYSQQSNYLAIVESYNSSLTRTTVTTGLSQGRRNLSGASIGNYALFAGGQGKASSATAIPDSYDKVDAYNASLTRTTPTALSFGRSGLKSTTLGDFALFCGGIYSRSTSSNVTDAYDTSLTRTTPTALTTARQEHSGASVGDYALFAGGNTSFLDSVEIYQVS